MRSPPQRALGSLSALALALLALAGCSQREQEADPCTLGLKCEAGPPDLLADGARDGRAPPTPDTTPVTDPPDGSQPPPDATAPYAHEDVTPAAVKQWLDEDRALALLDVREPSEYQQGHIAGATNLPWTSGVLQQQLGTLPTDRPLVVYCHSGSRSDQAATFLASRGFAPVYDMGGILGWIAAGYPVVTP